MKTTELMIGDWVYYWHPRKQYNVPMRITKKLFSLVNEVDDSLSPIPLTPEILAKNGFVYQDLPFEDFYEGHGLQIHGGNYADRHSNWYIICGINVAMDITYVHQLQHALKLCKIKKEIVL